MMPRKRAQAIVGHVGIEVSNLTLSKRFYWTLLSKLGFEVIMENESAVGFSNQTFQIWLAQPEKLRIKRESASEEESIVADHLAILVQDKETVDVADVEMEKDGFKPLFPCEEYPEFCPGYYAVSFNDPDNYVVEVYTRPNPP